jgi:hypothetical protein
MTNLWDALLWPQLPIMGLIRRQVHRFLYIQRADIQKALIRCISIKESVTSASTIPGFAFKAKADSPIVAIGM